MVEDSRTQFYTAVKAMLEGNGVPVSGGEGFTTLQAIKERLGEVHRLPPNGQIRQDLEALGFTHVKRKEGRFWRLPEGFKTELGVHDAPF